MQVAHSRQGKAPAPSMPRDRTRSRSRDRHKSRRDDSRERDRNSRKQSRSHGSSDRRREDRHDAKRSKHRSRSPDRTSHPTERSELQHQRSRFTLRLRESAAPTFCPTDIHIALIVSYPKSCSIFIERSPCQHLSSDLRSGHSPQSSSWTQRQKSCVSGRRSWQRGKVSRQQKQLRNNLLQHRSHQLLCSPVRQARRRRPGEAAEGPTCFAMLYMSGRCIWRELPMRFVST